MGKLRSIRENKITPLLPQTNLNLRKASPGSITLSEIRTLSLHKLRLRISPKSPRTQRSHQTHQSTTSQNGTTHHLLTTQLPNSNHPQVQTTNQQVTASNLNPKPPPHRLFNHQSSPHKLRSLRWNNKAKWSSQKTTRTRRVKRRKKSRSPLKALLTWWASWWASSRLKTLRLSRRWRRTKYSRRSGHFHNKRRRK